MTHGKGFTKPVVEPEGPKLKRSPKGETKAARAANGEIGRQPYRKDCSTRAATPAATLKDTKSLGRLPAELWARFRLDRHRDISEQF
ncbi:MAG TPA: hypothetical protein VHY32_04340 [Caulobacteraceae bacterium]|nr:hypothetical protein [Caulobacteraceae bacterium]